MTGDPKDTVSYDVQKHTMAAIYIKPKSSDTTFSIPIELEDYQGDIPIGYQAGDTVTITAPATFGNLYFTKWECASDPLINNVTSPIVTRSYSCTNIGRVDAYPVYSLKYKDTVEITISGSTYGSVRVEGWAD
jgi:hypothetical protein